MMYITTSDDTRKCPVTEISEQPLRFVGVGGLSTLHAISFILDRRPIREILLVDADDARLDFTVAALRAAMTAPTRQAWLEQVYAITCLHDEIRDCRDLPWAGQPEPTSVGWNFGALLEGAFPLPAIPVTTQLGPLSDRLEEWADDTVIWVADALHGDDGSDSRATNIDRALGPRLRALDRLANIRIYAAANGDGAAGANILVKDYEAMLTRQRPHFYTNEAIERMRLGDTMLYLMHDAGAPRPGQLPASTLIGPSQFLASSLTADTVVLHIMSQSPLHAETARKGLASSRRLLVLEHNFHTEDRHNLHNEGMTLPQVRALVGTREESVRWCFGRRGGLRRNFVAAFAGQLS